MKFTRIIGLVALAAVAAAAFIGASSASASVVLCKKLVTGSEKCPAGELLPKGTRILALAKNPELEAEGVSPVVCEDSEVTAETTAESGEPLGISITKLDFGKLPTPKLGEGCSTCTSGVHTAPPYAANISMTAGTTDFQLNSKGSAELLNCFGLGINCAYGEENITALIDPDQGKHAKAVRPEEKGLAEILIKAGLKLTSGSFFCPGKGNWKANYVVYALEPAGGGTKFAGYIALD